MRCPLCHSNNIEFYYEDEQRPYHQCMDCRLVFVPPSDHLKPADEKERYDLHENDPDDAGYRKFLSRLVDPMLERIPPNSSGLDFGSGPGPTLSRMMEEHGHQLVHYDLYYADHPEVFEQKYDFITATEVLEHLAQPREELDLLWQCLKTGGYLGIMTKLVRNRKAFSTWHYIRDDTHIAFFSVPTFKWIANYLDADIEFVGSDVIMLKKRAKG